MLVSIFSVERLRVKHRARNHEILDWLLLISTMLCDHFIVYPLPHKPYEQGLRPHTFLDLHGVQ
jgi:hypothetical protein